MMFFQLDKLDSALAYASTYDPAWVIVSIMMAVLSSYAALNASFNVSSQTTLSAKFLWSFISAVTFGIGVWAMHFIGMLALKLPCHVYYALTETLLSILPSILVSGLVFGVDGLDKRYTSTWLRALLLAIGVALMHYTGMAAMLIDGDIRYNPALFTTSIFLTLVFAYGALSFKENASQRYKGRTLWVAIIMGIAVSVMHYSAIGATYFIKKQISVAEHLPSNSEDLAVLVAVATTLIALVCLSLANYSRSKEATKQLRHSEESLKMTLESTGDCIWQWNIISDEVIFSIDWASKLGFTQGSPFTTGSIWLNNIHPEDIEGVVLNIQQCFSGAQPAFSSEFRLRGMHDWLWVLSRGKLIKRDRENKPTEMIGTLIDISERKRAANEIEYLAFYDALTGLPNRKLFLDRLKKSLLDLKEKQLTGALIFIDLDRFKNVNDKLGHQFGDLLLQEVAQRIKACVQQQDVVARLSGDEFVIMLTQLHGNQFTASLKVADLSHVVLVRLAEKYNLDGYEYHISASLGVNVFNETEVNSADILKYADIAGYYAKKEGGNCIRFYNPDMQKLINDRLVLEEDLHNAIINKQFELYYQAQIEHNVGIVGAEVLIRWRHPVRGLVSPLDFIGVAEETGLILPMGYWVLNEACDQIRQWQKNPGLQSITLAINVSARQFQDINFVQTVIDAIEGDARIGNKIKLELTESLLIDDIETTVQKMNALKSLGISFSMDDFGTGYSSLSYLTKLPFDQLKIDQSFTRNVGINGDDNALIKTIIGMSESLNLRVIAEGVETEAQRDFLMQHHCENFQGYLFSKPIVLSEFEQLVLSHDLGHA